MGRQRNSSARLAAMMGGRPLDVEHKERRQHWKATTVADAAGVGGGGGGAAVDDHGRDMEGEEAPSKGNNGGGSGGLGGCGGGGATAVAMDAAWRERWHHWKATTAAGAEGDGGRGGVAQATQRDEVSMLCGVIQGRIAGLCQLLDVGDFFAYRELG